MKHFDSLLPMCKFFLKPFLFAIFYFADEVNQSIIIRLECLQLSFLLTRSSVVDHFFSVL